MSLCRCPNWEKEFNPVVQSLHLRRSAATVKPYPQATWSTCEKKVAQNKLVTTRVALDYMWTVTLVILQQSAHDKQALILTCDSCLTLLFSDTYFKTFLNLCAAHRINLVQNKELVDCLWGEWENVFIRHACKRMKCIKLIPRYYILL